VKLDTGTEDLLCELRDDGVLVATLNRPETRNAFSAAMGRALGSIYEIRRRFVLVRIFLGALTSLNELKVQSSVQIRSTHLHGKFANQSLLRSMVMRLVSDSHLLCTAICALLHAMQNTE
jgi:hypothetical protein